LLQPYNKFEGLSVTDPLDARQSAGSMTACTCGPLLLLTIMVVSSVQSGSLARTICTLYVPAGTLLATLELETEGVQSNVKAAFPPAGVKMMAPEVLLQVVLEIRIAFIVIGSPHAFWPANWAHQVERISRSVCLKIIIIGVRMPCNIPDFPQRAKRVPFLWNQENNFKKLTINILQKFSNKIIFDKRQILSFFRGNWRGTFALINLIGQKAEDVHF